LEQREANRAKRIKAMDKVRPNIPAFAFQMPLKELELADDIVQAFKTVDNVGELMVRLQADEDNLRAALDSANAGDDAMDAIKEAIDSLVVAPPPTLAAAPAEVTAPAEVQEQAESVVATPESAAAPEAAVGTEEEEAPPAFIDEERPLPQPEPVKPPVGRRVPKAAKAQPTLESVDYAPYIEPVEAEEVDEGTGKKKKGKKGKNRRRELVFDERRGEVVAKRKRKGGRARDWGEFDDEV
jgi:hypothetical protein